MTTSPPPWRHYPPHDRYPASTPPPRKSRKGLKIGLGAAAVLIVGTAIGSSGGSSAPARYAPVVPVTPQATTVAPAPVVAAPPSGPLTTFGNGTYEIGTDIVPQKYRNPGPQSGPVALCYFDVTDPKGKIVNQGVANEGPSRVDLSKLDGYTFKTSGCQDWVPA